MSTKRYDEYDDRSDGNGRYYDGYDDIFIWHSIAKTSLRAIIGNNIKSDIIKQWISGKSRDSIAQSTGVSAGVVSNVVVSWRTALEVPVSEELRELAVALRKLGLSASECAIGSRVFKIMRSLGLDKEENEEELEEFLSDTYKQLKELGIQPETLASNLKQLTNLFVSMPLSEVSIYLMQKAQEKADLEREIGRLRSQHLEAKKLAEDILNRQRVTVTELQNYLNFKREMAYNEISIDDISNFSKLINVIKKTTDLHPAVVVSKFHTLDQVTLAQILLNQLKSEIDHLQEEKDIHMQVLKTYKELESLGLGLKELRLLRNTIREIVGANGIHPAFAVQKICSDIEEDYDAVLGFKSKLEKLRTEIRDEKSKRAAIQNQPYGVDWTSFFQPVQGSRVPQGQESTPMTPQEQNLAKTNNPADSGSGVYSDPKPHIGATSATKETKNPSQLSEFENENQDDEPTDEVRRL